MPVKSPSSNWNHSTRLDALRHHGLRRARRPLAVAVAAAVAAGALTACGGGAASDPNTVRVAFRKNTDANVKTMDLFLAKMKKEFEKTHKGKKVELVPVQASDKDYAAKIQQMMRSPKTAPDVVYEDTFLINSDIKSGYLKPLDPYLKKWDDWDQYEPNAKTSAQGQDGKTYGVPDGTDTRAIWFNKKIFKKAGLPEDWNPKTWDDVLEAARTVKKKVPGKVPLNCFTGKAVGEAATMQCFEMLLYGTGQDPLYDKKSKKWVQGSKGFKDSLKFVESVYGEKLGPDVDAALNPNIQTKIGTEYFPQEKLAIAIDGSFLTNHWLKTGGAPWPEWEKTMGMTPMPTQNGQGPGEVSLSGGWTWSVPAKSAKPDLAFELIKTLQSKENALEWTIRGSQIAVRKDVAEDKRYLEALPSNAFFTERVENSEWRPALPVYPQVSTAITEAMESVTTGDASPGEAAESYDEKLKSITDGAVVRKK